MSYVAHDLDHLVAHNGHSSVGTGQCVALVKAWTGAPPSSSWHQGMKVKGNTALIRRGTAIATFVHGHYPNWSHGNHAAIFLYETHDGIRVIDQWTGHAPSERTIHWHSGSNLSNNADAFSVVE